jgi:hypothetical protein
MIAAGASYRTKDGQASGSVDTVRVADAAGGRMITVIGLRHTLENFAK